MAEINLTQTEADALIAMPKFREHDEVVAYPDPGGSISVPLLSEDKREKFLLDVSRGRIDLTKVKHQNRARQVVILARLELGGAPHRNPDDEEIPCPHIHLYREGFGDKWAFPVPADKFSNIADPWITFQDFMRFCNVVKAPIIQKGLF